MQRLRPYRTVKLRLRGWPDRMVLLPGAPEFVETKRPKGGRFEPLQLRVHAMLRGLGYTVCVLRTKAEVDEYVIRSIERINHAWTSPLWERSTNEAN